MLQVLKKLNYLTRYFSLRSNKAGSAIGAPVGNPFNGFDDVDSEWGDQNAYVAAPTHATEVRYVWSGIMGRVYMHSCVCVNVLIVHVRLCTLNRSIYIGVLLVIRFSLIWSSEKLSSELI